MGETSGQIAIEIEQARRELGSNLMELEGRFRDATDWREHFYRRPYQMIAMAFAAGILLARLTARPSRSEIRCLVISNPRG